jgi:hypothetical protein
MPAEHCVRLDDQQHLFQGSKLACQQYEQRPVAPSQPWTFHLPFQHNQPLAQEQFSSGSSDLLRVKSMAAFRARLWLSGFVHWRTYCLVPWQRESMHFRTREKAEKLMACLSQLDCRPRFYHRTTA